MEPCCEIEGNLVEREREPNQPPEVVIRVCKQCGRRHFEATLDPAQIGIMSRPLG